jgi:hypothetical protein
MPDRLTEAQRIEQAVQDATVRQVSPPGSVFLVIDGDGNTTHATLDKQLAEDLVQVTYNGHLSEIQLVHRVGMHNYLTRMREHLGIPPAKPEPW